MGGVNSYSKIIKKLQQKVVLMHYGTDFDVCVYLFMCVILYKLNKVYTKQGHAGLKTRSVGQILPGRVAQSVGHLTRKSGVLGSIPGLATYFRFSFRFFKKGSCQLLAKVCARSTS